MIYLCDCLQDVNITIMSYVKVLRITLRTLKGFIDEQKFKSCLEKAFEVISKASMEIPLTSGMAAQGQNGLMTDSNNHAHVGNNSVKAISQHG
ncbi:hypothetical protein RIF29_09992 [Crotalaria pallida]|uniref:O-acyltransferase WSD1 C-terminal domain-containing protein n=1 Tax=Crotalaria pallida TaxID=3830 RepID=A0AAN9FYK3_CROPI